MTQLAPFADGIPVVQDNNDRTQKFAVPATDQRVFNKTSGAIERWNGAAWVTDFGGGAALTLQGTGSPEGVVVATVGKLYLQTDGANGEVLWRKASGVGNTGWRGTSDIAFPIATVTGAYLATALDRTILGDASGGVVTVTLPPKASAGGRIYTIKKIDGSANVVTIDANGAETIDGSSAISLTAPYEAVTIHCYATLGWQVIG